MHGAVEEGNTRRLISTLEYIRNIDFKDDQNETALHKAARSGHARMVELLLRKGVQEYGILPHSRTYYCLLFSLYHMFIVFVISY